MTDILEEPIDSPAFVELMGHRQIAGYARTVRVAGAGMLRITPPPVNGAPGHVQYVSPGAIYALHLVDEATMLAAVKRLDGRGTPAAITSVTGEWLNAAHWCDDPHCDHDDVVDVHVCETDNCDCEEVPF